MIWIIIDVSNWAHKLLHAAGGPDGAAKMFRRWLDLVVDKTEAERIVLAFDSAGPSFRRKLNPHYKAGRKDPPAGLAKLLTAIELLAIENAYDVASADGFEADDVIATVTRIGVESDRQVVICSTDKDLRQLLRTGRVVIIRSVSVSKGIEWYNEGRLMQEYNLRARQWIDYQTLVGDTSDNVAGCDNIGDKTARAILTACGSLDDHYANPWRAKINDRQRGSLSRFRGRLRDQARQLVTLRTDVPLGDGWEVLTA